MGRIDPYVDLADKVTVDFSGVRNANSSFVNALVAGIIEHHGEPVIAKLIFKGCNPAIQVLVEAAIYLRLRKTEGKISA
jgi:STAS-like domain of unknown function (DUF4325)